MILNKIYQTNPIFLHSPGRNVAGIWTKLYENIKTLPKQQDTNDNFTIITWNNQKISPLEHSLNRFNCEYRVLGKGITDWNNIYKIKLAYDELNKINTEYVIGLDAFDVLCLSAPSKSIDIFKTMNCDMLFNAGLIHYPPVRPDLKLFEESIAKDKKFCYLNAGMWVGKTIFVKQFLKTALSVVPEAGEWWKKSEQIYIKVAFKEHYPNVQIDYKSQIFQVVNLSNKDHIKLNSINVV